MYYAEKMIDGILHYKTTPDGDWNPMSIQELSRRVVKAERECQEMGERLVELDNEL